MRHYNNILVKILSGITLFTFVFLLQSCAHTNLSSKDKRKNVKNNNFNSLNLQIDEFSKRINNNKNKPNNSNDLILGLKALEKKNFEEANFYFQHALKFDPQNPYLHKLNAMCYHARGDKGDPSQYELALVGYQLANRMDPGDSAVPYYQGVLSYNLSRYRAAQEYFAKAVSINGRVSKYFLGLAASSYYLGEIDRAYIHIKKAHSIEPLNLNNIQAKGMIMAALGDFENAGQQTHQMAIFSDGDNIRSKQMRNRIDDWQNYYRSPRIKLDKDLQLLLAQEMDIYGIPKDGPLASSEDESYDNLDNVSSNDTPAVKNESTSKNDNTISNTSSTSQKKSTEAKKKASKPRIKKPNMALIDVAIIRTEEIYKSAKGVNLLNGLNLFFSGDDSFYVGETFGKIPRTALTTNDTFTIKLGTGGSGLNYSLNIFNDNYDRNEVIARPTILVQDNQKSTFFSGGTMHIVLEGGVAGSGSIEPIDVGVTLEVKPKFLDSETINISVLAQRTFLESTLSSVSDQLTGTSFAQTSKTKINANLTIRYGETMVLSGLSDQEKTNIDDKVPLLGDVPVVQYLFRNNTKLSAKKTVLILLTPRQATLSYEDGNSKDPEADIKNVNLTKLEKDTSWMRPSSNLRGIVYHLGKYDFFNQFRKSDIMLENWAGEGTFVDVIRRTLEYFYIRYGFEKNSHSEL